MPEGLGTALQRVRYDTYSLDGDHRLPQSSSPDVVAHVLEALDVEPGMAVAEVGTGSGYGTALLSHLVGDAGRVLSMDVDPHLTRRAGPLLRADGRGNVELAAGDARHGLPDRGPFDRLVAWATAERIPDPWIAACTGSARLLVPVQVAPLDGAAPVACIGLQRGAPESVRFTWGSFIPMTAAAVADFAAHDERRGDVRRSDAAGTAWLSAAWIREAPMEVRRRLAGILSGLRPGPELLQPPERAEDLWWFLVATGPRGLTSAHTPASGPAFGHGGPDGLALIQRRHGTGAARCLVAGNAMRSLLQVQGWIRTWQAAGRIGLDGLSGSCRRDEAAHGWRVEAALGSRP